MALNQALDGSVFNGEGEIVSNDDETICESGHFTSDLKYKCETCTTSFGSISTLRRHRLKVHQGYGDKYCVDCRLWFVNLNQHRTKVHGEGLRKFECRRCMKKFEWVGERDAHESNFTNCKTVESELVNKQMVEDVMDLAVQHFKQIEADVSFRYQMLHDAIENSMGTDSYLNSGERVSDKVRSILTPSFQHLERLHYIELIRLGSVLRSEVN